jgi:hypothetical protein
MATSVKLTKLACATATDDLLAEQKPLRVTGVAQRLLMEPTLFPHHADGGHYRRTI